MFYVLNEQGYLQETAGIAPADVLILPMTEDMAPAIQLSEALRAQEIRTQLYCEQKKFKHKVGYADKLHIPYVIFLGEDEIKENVYTLKDMRTGTQTKLSLDAAIEYLKKNLAAQMTSTVITEKTAQ